MSMIDDLVESISGVASKIDEATSETAASSQQADEMRATAEALGAESLVEGLAQVKEQLEALAEALRGASERAGEIQVLARSAAEGS